MKSHYRLLGVAVVFMLLLSSCGAKSPQDVAKSFVEALADGDLDKAKELATDRVDQSIQKLQLKCAKPSITALAKASIAKVKEINKKIHSDEGINKNLRALQKEYNSKNKELLDAFKKKMKKDRYSISSEEKDKRLEEFRATISNLANEIGAKIISMIDAGIKDEQVREVVTRFAVKLGTKGKLKYKDRELISLVAQEIIHKNPPKKVTAQCIDKYTPLGNLDTITIIETKQDSNDKVNVRFELISKEGKSKKTSLYVEKIQDKWKVREDSLIEVGIW